MLQIPSMRHGLWWMSSDNTKLPQQRIRLEKSLHFAEWSFKLLVLRNVKRSKMACVSLSIVSEYIKYFPTRKGGRDENRPGFWRRWCIGEPLRVLSFYARCEFGNKFRLVWETIGTIEMTDEAAIANNDVLSQKCLIGRYQPPLSILTLCLLSEMNAGPWKG